MMCYKDRTFCSFYKDCKQGEGCWRAMTEEVQAAAKKKSLPIAWYVARPECHLEMEEEEDE